MPDEICPNGSVRNPDVPDFIVIDNEHMTQLLPPDWQWLGQFLPFIPPIALDTNVLCSIDPPEYPDVGAIQWFALAAQLPIGGAVEAGRLVAQIVTNLLWYRICHCLVDSTPPIPAAPAPPANLPVLNPPVVVPPVETGPCLSGSITPFNVQAGVGPTFTGFAANGIGLDVTMVRITAVVEASTGNFDVEWSIYQQNQYSPIENGHIHSFTQGVGTRVVELPYDPFFPVQTVYARGLAGTGIRVLHVTAELFCAGRIPDGPAPECCPPDPLLTSKLDQILSMVTLLQRQGEPFAYVPGPAVHSGLVGFGELAVSGLIGVRVEVTTLPPELGHLAGTPDMLFDVGWVSIGTAEGWERRTRIDALEQLLIPAHMGLITRVGYSLSPNVVIRISELKREP